MHIQQSKRKWLIGPIAAAVILLASILLPAGSAGAWWGGIDHLPNGTVLRNKRMVLSDSLDEVARGRRIVYVSEDSSGNKIRVSGAIIKPRRHIVRENRDNADKVVAWAHGTTGMGDNCAPSDFPNLAETPDYNNFNDAVVSYVSQGYTVAATDYQGIGTRGDHPYLVGDAAARGVIDSVRAATNMVHRLSGEWIVSGHSQGGQAAIATGEISDTYGAGLDLKGVVAIAPVSNLNLVAPQIPGGLANGYLVMMTYGHAQEFDTVSVENVLTQQAIDDAGVLDTGCFAEILFDTYATYTAEEIVPNGVVASELIDALAATSPGQTEVNVPTYIVQGGADVQVFPQISQLLLSQMCAVSTSPVFYQEYPGQDHSPVIYASLTDVTDFMADRFAGVAPQNSCM